MKIQKPWKFLLPDIFSGFIKKSLNPFDPSLGVSCKEKPQNTPNQLFKDL